MIIDPGNAIGINTAIIELLPLVRWRGWRWILGNCHMKSVPRLATFLECCSAAASPFVDVHVDVCSRRMLPFMAANC